jgi:hypothetical protein
LRLIDEVVVGDQKSGLYTRSADSHKVEVGWYIQKGDLLGIYNARSVYVGNDDSETADAMYLEYEGDFSSLQDIAKLQGYGNFGLGLYGTNDVKQDKAIYDIELDGTNLIDFLDIFLASDSDNQIEYNLCAAINNGLSIVSNVTGYHTHVTFRYSTALLEYIEHPNIAYNIQSISDGLRYASNGYLGIFQQTVPEASYFYISGVLVIRR